MEQGIIEAKPVGNRLLRLIRDDLTLLEVDAFVFYAQLDLKLGSGYGGAIAVRGGPSIQQELDGMNPLETCDAVITAAGDLKARHIIHAAGPRFQEEDLEEKLRRTMRRVLDLAAENGIETLAFPPMGTGFYGIALDQCARVMVEEIESHLGGETSVKEATICIQDVRERAPFQNRINPK